AALTVHHIASDGWSMGILVREVAALYVAFAEGRPSPLPELPVQYADYSSWQRSWLHGEVLETEISYWRRQLAGLPPLLELPTDRPRPAAQSFRGASRPVRLPAGLTRQIEAVSRREGATLFMVLLAGFQTLLARYSNQQDLAVGSPAAGRNRVEIEDLIGFFVNTLALRGDLSGTPTFRELIGRVRETALAAWLHQDVPFERLIQELAPERSLAHAPLFQVMLVLQNAPAAELRVAGLTLSPVAPAGATARFDLTLSLGEAAGGLAGAVEYATDLFDAVTIDRLIGHYERLLTGLVGMVEEPELRAGEIGLLSPEEELQLHAWNETATAYPFDRPLHAWIEDQVDRTPWAVAVVCAGVELSYGELDRRANRLAWRLRALGVGPESRVAVCLERSTDLEVALLAVLKAGGAYVPLDPEYPRERLAFMLTDARPMVLLSSEPLLDRLPEPEVPVVWLDGLDVWLGDARSGGRLPDGFAGDQQLAYMIYTSGSTGRPKGAMVSHRSICNRLLWMQDAYRLTAADAVLQKTPFSFDVSVWEFFWPLLAGARLVVARPGGHRDGAYLVDLIARERVTVLHFVPSMLQAFLEEPDLDRCRSLRKVVVSGEALGADLAERFFARLPIDLIDLENLYGPTEAAVDVTVWGCRPGAVRRPVPICRPIANTAIHVLDPGGRPVPVGVPGELHIGGVNVGRGYLGRPDLTAEKFVPDPFGASFSGSFGTSGARLYRTGELARFAVD